MPKLKIFSEIINAGVDQTIETSATVSEQDISDLLPVLNDFAEGWAHWSKAEEIVVKSLRDEIFPNEITPILKASDLKNMGVTGLKVTISNDEGRLNTFTLI